MPPKSIDRESVRRLDRRAIDEFGVPGIVLMENAGRGVAEKLCELGVAGRVVLCCGPGNNGGDAFVIARHLDLRQIAVEVLCWNCRPDLQSTASGSSRSDAEVNLQILMKSNIHVRFDPDPAELPDVFRGAAWIVDALLGTGARGEPRPPFDAIVEAMNASGLPIMAIDLPSGLDCDTGTAAQWTVRASHTCTFVAPKPGFFAPGAAQYTGTLHVVDIGAPRALVEAMLQEAAGNG